MLSEVLNCELVGSATPSIWELLMMKRHYWGFFAWMGVNQGLKWKGNKLVC